jgi:DNA-binding response OmpR family regulator
MSQLVTIVEDEADIAALMALHLSKAGFLVERAENAEVFFRLLQRHIPSLVILDLMLPDVDGLEICRHMKKMEDLASIPIIMVTARTAEADRVVGLEMGADDYVTKPFSPRELVARVRAVLRRRSPSVEERTTIVGDLVINPGRFEVTVGGNPVVVTSTEFKILELLCSRRGWVFTREKILDHLWGAEKAVLDRTVDVHVKNLREKLGKAKHLIKNVRGIGYKVEE